MAKVKLRFEFCKHREHIEKREESSFIYILVIGVSNKEIYVQFKFKV